MKKLSIHIFLLFFIIFSYSASSATEKMRIAIMDFEAKDISKRDASKISELVRNEMVNIDKFIIIERAQMNQILKEQGLQQTGCTDVSCAVEVGRLLSTRKILVGTVMKLEENIIITGRIVDVEKGIAEFSEKAIAIGGTGLYSTVSTFCKKLSNRIGGENNIELVKEEESVKISNPYAIPAFGLTGLGLASLGGGIYFNKKIDSLRSDYDSLYEDYQASTDAGEAESLRKSMKDKKDDADKAILYRNISYGIGAVSFLAAGYFLYRFFTYEPVTTISDNSHTPGVMPLFYSNHFLTQNYCKDDYFFGGGVMIRF